MKHEILSTAAAIALLIVLVWIHMTPCRANAPPDAEPKAAKTVPTQPSPISPDDTDTNKSLKRDFHTVFDAFFGR